MNSRVYTKTEYFDHEECGFAVHETGALILFKPGATPESPPQTVHAYAKGAWVEVEFTPDAPKKTKK